MQCTCNMQTIKLQLANNKSNSESQVKLTANKQLGWITCGHCLMGWALFVDMKVAMDEAIMST